MVSAKYLNQELIHAEEPKHFGTFCHLCHCLLSVSSECAIAGLSLSFPFFLIGFTVALSGDQPFDGDAVKHRNAKANRSME